VSFLLGSALVLNQYKLPAVFASSAVQNVAAVKAPGEAVKETASTSQQPINATRAAREEKVLQDARRQQMDEKAAALAAKEQELKKLSAKIEAQVKALEDSKKRIDGSLKTQSEIQKKKLGEKRKRMLTLLKKMRPEQAGQYLGKMEEVAVVSILNDLDNKMILKLMPYLNQPLVLKWIKENLNNS
jgi:flagellar motility protein MotE (MotC chaperone)